MGDLSKIIEVRGTRSTLPSITVKNEQRNQNMQCRSDLVPLKLQTSRHLRFRNQMQLTKTSTHVAKFLIKLCLFY